MLDEYGQPKKTKLSGPCVKVNLLKVWRKVWGPSNSDIGERLTEIKRRQAEFESWFEKATEEQRRKDALIAQLQRELKKRDEAANSKAD